MTQNSTPANATTTVALVHPFRVMPVRAGARVHAERLGRWTYVRTASGHKFNVRNDLVVMD